MRDTTEEEADKPQPHKCHAAVGQSMATPASGGQAGRRGTSSDRAHQSLSQNGLSQNGLSQKLVFFGNQRFATRHFLGGLSSTHNLPDCSVGFWRPSHLCRVWCLVLLGTNPLTSNCFPALNILPTRVMRSREPVVRVSSVRSVRRVRSSRAWAAGHCQP